MPVVSGWREFHIKIMFDREYSDSEIKKILGTLVMLVDTREKKGKNDHILNFWTAKGVEWRKQKLDYGDYSCLLPANEELGIPEDISFASEIMVERKQNLTEISGNVSDSTHRIYRELKSAPPHKVLLIENNTYNDLVNGNYNTKLAPKAFWAALLSMWHRYGIPVFFMPDTRYTGQFIYGYLYYYVRDKLKHNASSTTNGGNNGNS